jgi:uncharacterized protein YaaW (UPF0174 family)
MERMKRYQVNVNKNSKNSRIKQKIPKKFIIRTPLLKSAKNEIADVPIDVAKGIRRLCAA